MVHVNLPDGIRLATLTAGMPFGEMALLEPRRSADVLADMAATAFEVPLPTSSVFGSSIRASASGSCATSRNCSPTV